MPENQSPAARRQRRRSDIIGMGFLILMLPILLVTVVPMVIVVGGTYLLVAVLLHIAVVSLWFARVVRPLDARASELQLYPDGLKLSVAVTPPPATTLGSGLHWWLWKKIGVEWPPPDPDTEA